MDCIFCKIINKEVGSKVVYENDHAISFLDVHPHAPGHTVVIPKVHTETILDLPDEYMGPLMEAVRESTRILKEKMEPEGFTIGINHGSVAGQAVPHLHIHVLPRWKGDGGGSIHSVVQHTSKASDNE
jgi:histidine triad (HIT) family protein